MVSESGVSAHHFGHAYVTRPKAKAHRRIDIGIVDTIVVKQLHQLVGIQAAHQICGYPVVTLCQTPLQRHHLPIPGAAAIARSPWLAGHHVRSLHVGGDVAGRIAIFHSQAIEKRLNGRTYLAATTHHHVIHEMLIVQSSHVGFHRTRLGIHAHHTAAQELLVITNAVHGRHQRIHVPMVSEYGHVHLRVESLVDFLIAATSLPHHAIALALGLAAIKNRSHLLCRQIAIGGVGLSPVFPLKLRLQVMGHMVIHGLFGKLLHAAINSGIHFQAVGIEIIGFSIPFPVLVAPSVQWVCLPSDAVIDILILVPAGIARLVIPVRSLGHHIETQELPEIGGRAILVVYAMEIQLQGFHPLLVILRLGEISHFQHLG